MSLPLKFGKLRLDAQKALRSFKKGRVKTDCVYWKDYFGIPVNGGWERTDVEVEKQVRRLLKQ